MVEIRREEENPRSPQLGNSVLEEEKYRLLYSKSKVYIHPTAYARDNIPGFVVLVKRVSSAARVPRIYSGFRHVFRRLSMLLTF